jgi:hypothetical protein
LVNELTKFAGSENLAGIYAVRRQIMEHPAFAKAAGVQKKLSDIDQGLKYYGTDVTTDGRQVSALDVFRMVGSGDAQLQKEGLRILALQSENGLGYVDALPLSGDAQKDPLFRFHVKTFIKENPRIDPQDYAMYEGAKKLFMDSMKYQYKNDPMMGNAMLTSPQVQEQLREMRETMLRGKATRKVDWAPPPGSSDFVVGDDELKSLQDVVSNQIEYAGRGAFGRFFNEVGNLVPGGDKSRAALRGMQKGSGTFQRLRADGAGGVGGIPQQSGLEPTERAGIGPGAAAGTGAVAGGLLGWGTAAAGSGVAAPIAIGAAAGAAVGTVFEKSFEYRAASDVIEAEKLKSQFYMNSIRQYKTLLEVEVDKLGKGDGNEENLQAYYSGMTDALAAYNKQMKMIGLEYELSPLHLFTRKQFQVISTRAAKQQAQQAARMMQSNPGLFGGGGGGSMQRSGGGALAGLGGTRTELPD